MCQVNAQVIEAASTVGTQMAFLAGGILSPVAVSQPVATSNADGVLARAFQNDRGEVYVAVVNERLAPVANISLGLVLADGANPLVEAGCVLSVPFEEARTLSAPTSGLITEPLGSYEARVYRIESAAQTTPTWDSAGEGSDLVVNAQFSKQTLPGTPDRWLLFPSVGTPSGGMDLEAVLLADAAAARHGSNNTAALRVVISNPLGTGIHIPLAVDSDGLSADKRYNVSFWAKVNAVTTTGVVALARSPRAWHYGDSSPALLETIGSFMVSSRWQHYCQVLSGVVGTLNLLPREAGVLWLSEISVVELELELGGD
jgi:hypothetical protein